METTETQEATVYVPHVLGSPTYSTPSNCYSQCSRRVRVQSVRRLRLDPSRCLYRGSRIAEYGQSKIPKGYRWAVIPKSADSGPWAGLPLAFIPADFTFYDSGHILVPSSHCLDPKLSCLIHEIEIRFRFDKSANNFTIRKYRRQSGVSFDAIGPVINIFRRATILGIEPNEPLGQYGVPSKSPTKFDTFVIRDTHVRDVMREACREAYPNPLHYCRLHISSIVAHSNRVTAAVCLKMGGASDEEIAFRLRWHIDSVPTYLRECGPQINLLMQKAIAGALLNT